MHKRKLLVKLMTVTFVAITGFSVMNLPIVNQGNHESTVDAATVVQTQAFVKKMGPTIQAVSKEKNLYSSVMLAQMILECSWGQSKLATQANNYFGMKGSYNGQSYSVKSLEYDKKGNPYYAVSKFRKYPNVKASIEDYANHMRNGVDWDANYYSGTWREKASTYQKATAALSLRYSTSSAYGKMLNTLISTYGLHELDQDVKVAYNGAAGSETVKVTNSGYRLYNHVKGTAGSTDKGVASKLAGKTVYADMRGVKDGSTTWYRVRAKGTTTKYWIYSQALKLRKVNYSAMNIAGTFNGKSYQLHNHVYNSEYLSKKTGDSKSYRNKKYTINNKAVITDYNGVKSTMHRIKIGANNHWVYTGAVKKQALDKLEKHRADGSETATVNANSYVLYNTVKNTTDNTVSYGMSTKLTGQKVQLLSRAEKRNAGTTWYQIKVGSEKYWVYANAVTFNQQVTYKALKQTATVSKNSAYRLHDHVYNSEYLSSTTAKASDTTIKGQAVTIDCMATIKEKGKANSYMYRFTVKSTGKTYWTYGSVLVGRANAS
ncbi:glucosaminidase domain-containing protein [Dellaglioa sp. BT-FLS60]